MIKANNHNSHSIPERLATYLGTSWAEQLMISVPSEWPFIHSKWSLFWSTSTLVSEIHQHMDLCETKAHSRGILQHNKQVYFHCSDWVLWVLLARCGQLFVWINGELNSLSLSLSLSPSLLTEKLIHSSPENDLINPHRLPPSLLSLFLFSLSISLPPPPFLSFSLSLSAS